MHSEQICSCIAACRASHTKFYANVASCKIHYEYAKMSFSTIKIVKIGKKHMQLKFQFCGFSKIIYRFFRKFPSKFSAICGSGTGPTVLKLVPFFRFGCYLSRKKRLSPTFHSNLRNLSIITTGQNFLSYFIYIIVQWFGYIQFNNFDFLEFG